MVDVRNGRISVSRPGPAEDGFAPQSLPAAPGSNVETFLGECARHSTPGFQDREHAVHPAGCVSNVWSPSREITPGRLLRVMRGGPHPGRIVECAGAEGEDFKLRNYPAGDRERQIVLCLWTTANTGGGLDRIEETHRQLKRTAPLRGHCPHSGTTGTIEMVGDALEFLRGIMLG